jgi:Family of unknown function (DUF6580)
MEVAVKRWQLLIALSLIVFGIVMRVLPHPANLAPIGAIALFGGATLDKRIGWWLPVVVMAISDVYLGLYSSVLFTWLGFLLVGLIGLHIRRYSSWLRVPFGSLAGSITFFLVSNFGVWLVGGLYAHTWNGFITCYALALPFLRPTILGDLIYSAVFFGLYGLAMRPLYSRKSPSLT